MRPLGPFRDLSAGPAVDIDRCREAHHRNFAAQQIEGGGTAEDHGLIAVTTAGIMRIGGGDQRGPVLALINKQGLAVVGAEVQQVQITAQGNLARANRVG